MESVKSLIISFLKGCVDSLKGVAVLLNLEQEIRHRDLMRSSPQNHQNERTIQESSIVMKRIMQSCMLNGFIFLLSILSFEYIMLPAVKYVVLFLFVNGDSEVPDSWMLMSSFVSIFFKMIWLLPLYLISKLVNCMWVQDIADSAFRHRRGRTRIMSNVSTAIADSLFSLLVQTLFLGQSMLVSSLPITYVGDFLCSVHLCLLYALYSFEYKWYNMGWELHMRLTFIETNWPYFLGFGLPLALLTQMCNSYMLNGCIFSLLFPVFILSANEATPVFGCEYPLRLFSPVVAISNCIFRLVRRGATNENRR